jgi:hypothetical protein
MHHWIIFGMSTSKTKQQKLQRPAIIREIKLLVFWRRRYPLQSLAESFLQTRPTSNFPLLLAILALMVRIACDTAAGSAIR